MSKVIKGISSLVKRNNIELQTFKMLYRPSTAPIIKYSILKPNPLITSIKRDFSKPFSSCEYEIAVNENIRVRKYRHSVKSLEAILQDCQWRSQQKCSIVKCHYVELLPLNLPNKDISVQEYIDDLQVTVSQMKKLILTQAVYMINEAVLAYKILWERFREVSVNYQTIGLDCNGNCLVWINRSLEKKYPEQCKLSQANSIMREIVFIIKSKCQPVCYNQLAKLLDNLEKKFTFQQGLHVINQFSKIRRLKLPEHLKFLVNQYRLDKKLAEFKNNRQRFDSREYLQSNKIPPFLTSRRKPFENVTSTKNLIKIREKKQIFSTIRKTTSPNWTLRQNHESKFKDSVFSNKTYRFNLANNLYSQIGRKKNKKNTSRCKSQQSEYIKVVTNIRPQTKKQIETNISIKNFIQREKSSGISDNIKTAGSFTQIESNKKQKNNLSSASVPKKIIQLNPREQCQSIECSPFLIRQQNSKIRQDNRRGQESQKEQNSFRLILESDIIRANNWTKTVKNILQTQVKLNASITVGKDANNQLLDNKLENLNLLDRKLEFNQIPIHLK